MNTIQTILAILPGVVICLWIFYRDRHDREPFLMLLMCFLAGIGSSFPAILMEEFGFSLGIRESENILDVFILAFVGVAFPEELVKFICVMIFAYPWKSFDEPLDGIVYSVMVAMGFATIENLIYSDLYGIDTVILRAFTAVPAHAAFAIFMGYHIGLAKFDDHKKWKHLSIGFFGAIIIHGAYDFFLLQQNIPVLTILSMIILIICIVYTRKLVALHTTHSESRIQGQGFNQKLTNQPEKINETPTLVKNQTDTPSITTDKNKWDNFLK